MPSVPSTRPAAWPPGSETCRPPPSPTPPNPGCATAWPMASATPTSSGGPNGVARRRACAWCTSPSSTAASGTRSSTTCPTATSLRSSNAAMAATRHPLPRPDRGQGTGDGVGGRCRSDDRLALVVAEGQRGFCLAPIALEDLKDLTQLRLPRPRWLRQEMMARHGLLPQPRTGAAGAARPHDAAPGRRRAGAARQRAARPRCTRTWPGSFTSPRTSRHAWAASLDAAGGPLDGLSSGWR